MQCFVPLPISKDVKNVKKHAGPKVLDTSSDPHLESDPKLVDHNILQQKRPPSESSISFKVYLGKTAIKFQGSKMVVIKSSLFYFILHFILGYMFA